MFEHADRLDVTGEARHHVAFGYGGHQCLGRTPARVELQVVYGMAFKDDMLVYGVHSLPVTS
ncbi:hypothetical protein [Amycolatopsis sp. SID8362]|uniref:hypothetical protein n=1 Tax=Amycolatopsis sp. SID8362 TaxID=2690346 RepID=UPI00136ACDD2|nr:hypothetical protein [Amycolatopsis sp. SID8362]NBH05707.1 hypothetical protein [Amycolatopsis sp. SID8362]NED42405.1 hypothetical protein [Amycolatopsis sp. SID8362]